MAKTLGILLTLLCLSMGAVVWLHHLGAGVTSADLTVLCAASLKPPMEAVGGAYRAQSGEGLRLQWGGSATLLGQIQITRRGDVLITADEGTMTDARRGGWVLEAAPLLTQRPVFAVRAGNPKAIHELSDLFRPDVRVGLADPKAASIGRATRDGLGEVWPKLAAHAAVMKPVVTEIAGDLVLGAVDVAVVWDSTLRQFPGLQRVDFPGIAFAPEHAWAATLTRAAHPAAAQRFAAFLRTQASQEVFKSHGYAPATAQTP